MMSQAAPLYMPALRMKAGELEGVQQLADDIKSRVLPHFIVPPRAERDKRMRSLLADLEEVPGAGHILSKHWIEREVLLNLKYLFSEFGEAKSGIWFPKAFEQCLRERVWAVPVASVGDVLGSRGSAIKDAMFGASMRKVAINVDIEEPGGLSDQLMRALDRLSVTPKDCALMIDFTGSDLSQPELVSGVLEAAIETVEEIGRWSTIAFQGSSYPEKNLATPGSSILLPRSEWKAWSGAVAFDARTSPHLLFGDFGADCSKMQFGPSRAAPICHYRYTTPEHWLVVRGGDSGGVLSRMKDVCDRILKSGHFAGRTFSSADEWIFQNAHGRAGPGTPTNWRGANTTHHITRVVRDIGHVKGLKFAELAVLPLADQLSMFEAG